MQTFHRSTEAAEPSVSVGPRMQRAAVQRRNQPGANQRRLAGAGGAEHRHESLLSFELGQQVAHVRIAAEKEQRFALGKGPQPDVR